MEIIHIVPKFTQSIWGGAESLIVDLVKNYPLSIKSEVWTCKTPGDKKEECIDGITVRRFFSLYPYGKHMIGLGKPGIPLGLLLKVFILRLRSKSIILHLHVHNALSAAVLMISKMVGIKSILTLHSRVAHLQPYWRYYWSNIFPIRNATRVVAVSDEIATQATAVTGRKDITVIPNGVDIKWLQQGDRKKGRTLVGLSGDDKEKVLLFVGRIARVKNLETLLQAFSFLVKSICIDNSFLVIVGPESEPGYMHLLKHMCVNLRIRDRVIFVGSVPHRSKTLADLYAAADIVVIPSTFEAQSVTVLEAWGAERPVVVSDVGGMGPMVRKTGAGFLWSPVTGSKGLAEVLCQALGMVGNLKEKIRFAREYYDIQKTVKKYVNLYFELIHE